VSYQNKAHAHNLALHDAALADLLAVDAELYGSLIVDPQHNGGTNPIAGLLGRIKGHPAHVYRTTLGTWSAYVGTGPVKVRAHGQTPRELALNLRAILMVSA